MGEDRRNYKSITILCCCPDYVEKKILTISNNLVQISKIVKAPNNCEIYFYLTIQYLTEFELVFKVSNNLMALSDKAIEHYKKPTSFFTLRKID